MNRIATACLALSVAALALPAQAQSAYSDYARVVRVEPVGGDARCSESRTYGYEGDHRYGRDAYGRDERYARDGYDRYPDPRDGYGRSTGTGSTVATVVGGLVGAVIGSKVGGGSARYATSALGSMVGGMAGREIYERTQQPRQPRVGVARTCSDLGSGGASAFDVTYEYGGRTHVTRTAYHPGDRIRVRVDVQPD